jgi:hypothetical protein
MEIATALLIISISLLIGYAAGNLLSGKGASRDNSPAAENRDLVEVVRIWRNRRKGGITLELDGKLFTSVAELGTAQRARLGVTVDDLRAWLGSPVKRPLPSEPAAADLSSQPGGVSPVEREVQKQPAIKPVDMLANALRADVPKQVSQPKSIAAQIDEILQKKLAASDMQDRAIRLLELPGKGLVVMVGLDQYEGVENVPDAEIRALIRDCVVEWEAGSQNS